MVSGGARFNGKWRRGVGKEEGADMTFTSPFYFAPLETEISGGLNGLSGVGLIITNRSTTIVISRQSSSSSSSSPSHRQSVVDNGIRALSTDS